MASKDSGLEVTCHECSLAVMLPVVEQSHKAQCPRCGYTLTVLREGWQDRSLAFAIAAGILLLLSLLFSYISFNSHGLQRSISLVSSLNVLAEQGYFVLSLSVAMACIVFPASVLCLIIYLAGAVRFNWPVRNPEQKIKFCFALIPWCMAEIFTVGVLVSLVKIISMANVEFGLSFYAYCGFTVAFLLSVLYFDRLQLEKSLLGQDRHEQPETISESSVQNTWALLVTAIILYIPANILPIMTTRFLGNDSPATIMSGVISLWQHGSYPIAGIIFVASVFVPIAKMGILVWLNFSVQVQSRSLARERVLWYRVTEFVGRWSMVDVFVVAVLVSLVQLDGTMSIYPGPAVISFCGVVILTMIAAMTFDSRLIWNASVNNERI